MTTGYPSGQANSYPMSQTLGYFSTDGINWSAPTVLMTESTYQSLGWVQTLFNGASFNPLHLWAPSAQQGTDGNWYLYVPDISDSMHPATSSFIGVSRSTTGDPMGPYTPIGKVSISDYASDPDVVDTMSGRFGTGPYLAWADGDGSNCGGISIAPLSNDMTDLNAAPTRPVFDGIPSTFGTPCTDRFGRSHFYMEGPHIYNTTLGGPGSPGAAAGNWPAGTPGPYLMVVPIKPTSTPPECATSVQGQPGTANELIAYSTAGSPLGDLHADGTYHWTYGGILMCGSQKEFTDQGSIIPVTTSARTGGHTPLIFVYHDGPGANSTGHHRTIHAECLLWDAGDTHGGTAAGPASWETSHLPSGLPERSSPIAAPRLTASRPSTARPSHSGALRSSAATRQARDVRKRQRRALREPVRRGAVGEVPAEAGRDDAAGYLRGLGNHAH